MNVESIEFIDLKAQYKHIKDKVNSKINQVLESGQFILGEEVFELEKQLSRYTKSKHCITVADGTKALLIALMALDIKPGDEVIVPAFTFIATASMILLLNAIPVFVDIEKKSYNIDVNKIEQAITKKTKAIITVSMFGQCADMDAINLLAIKHNLYVIEDAAQSFGATYKGRNSTNLSLIGCTSFFPSKPLGCYGDGGACFTNDENLAIKMRQIRVHGQDSRYHHARLGVNGRLDTLQAAILLVKLEIFSNEVLLRQQIGLKYNELLAACDCELPTIMPFNTHVFAQYSLLVKNREEFIQALKKSNIPTAVHYPIPLHKQPILKQYYTHNDLSISEEVATQVVSIPMHPYLSQETMEYIVSVIKKNI